MVKFMLQKLIRDDIKPMVICCTSESRVDSMRRD
jgi:hypothetical protein